MYQDIYGMVDNNSQQVSNEISITNLIAIANNPTIFNALDQDTQEKLIKIICGYTKACVSSISNAQSTEAHRIRSVL